MAVNTNKMGPGTLTVGALAAISNMTAQITEAKLVPSTESGDSVYVLSGETVVEEAVTSWTLEGSMFQDLGAVDSVTEYLFEKRGTVQPFIFTPATSTGKQIEGSVVISATEIGGTAGQKNQSEFTFQLVGDPSINDIA